MWEKEQDPGNPFLLKLKDSVVLVGLGAVGLVAIGSSVFANSAVGWGADQAGIEGGAGRVLLFFTGLVIALVVDFLRLLLYCGAWTATAAGTAVQSGETAEDESPEPGTSPAADRGTGHHQYQHNVFRPIRHRGERIERARDQ